MLHCQMKLIRYWLELFSVGYLESLLCPRRLLFTLFVKGRKIISNRLLSLWVRHDGPATIGRSFSFLTFFTSTYEAFVCLHLLLIS